LLSRRTICLRCERSWPRFADRNELDSEPDCRPSLAAELIDKHGLAAGDQRLFRLLLPSGNAAVRDGLVAIAGPAVTTLSLRRGIA
jgi:hypothetical protein